MKKMFAICVIVLVSSSLLVSLPAFGENIVSVEDGLPVIVKVYGYPVGIESNFKSNKCDIQYGVLPGNTVKVASGKDLRIRVIGGDDVVVRCHGKHGISIRRD